MVAIILILASNTFFVLGFVYLFSIFLPQVQMLPTTPRNLVFGVTLGIFGTINMMLAVTLETGIIIDLRNPFVVVAGVFSGWIGAVTTAAVLSLYRWFIIGGIGALPGTLGIITCIVIGVPFYRLRRSPSPPMWLLLGAISMLPPAIWTTLTLPPDINRDFLISYIPAALLLYPLAAFGIGSLIQREQARWQLREALRISEQRFRAIFNESMQLMALLTPEGRVLEINQTALALRNTPLGMIQGKYVWELKQVGMSADAAAKLQASVHVAAGGEVVRYRSDLSPDGTPPLLVEFSIKPIFNQHHEVVHLIVEGRDLTQEIWTEQQRIAFTIERERNELLKTFIEDSSHHLRTPVTVLRTSLYLFESGIRKARETNPHEQGGAWDRVARRINIFRQSLDDLSRLIEDMLALVRAEQRDSITPIIFDMNKLLTKVVESFEPIATQAAVRCIFVPTLDPVRLYGDIDELEIVLCNLIENALHYTPAGGSVRLFLNLDATANHAVIRVEDTGIGIAPDDLAHIFERFYRADNARHHNSRGNGLGLAISQKIINAYGGTIQVESIVGKGTTFTVRLPLAVAIIESVGNRETVRDPITPSAVADRVHRASHHPAD